ncbi:arylesterase [Novosphingobium sp. 9U]|uniref:arylesterase n=1 Tax=Novosphingobium sp. 9U TaxID=2653158 RepID=UPI0012F2E41D|nr:arylesterase [Novosphingobium sp. 9U]VWX46863.1 GDSL family lipase [Novosphingobium sp. 9U]
MAACGSGKEPAPQNTADPLEQPVPIPVMGPERPILAFGDSLLAGYGLHEGESYPAKLEAALRARGVNARIANAGVSGETTQQGLRRLERTLDAQPVRPDLVIVSLGGNDMLQGRAPAETRANLDAILAALQRRKVRVVLLGMLAAPALSADYARDFNPIYPSLAHKYGATLVPFFLQPLQGKPDLVQPDRAHPTALGIEEMVAATVDDVAEALPRRELRR